MRTVLLRQQAGDGLEVLAVAGAVSRDDTPRLLEAVHSAGREPQRGLLLDLREVTELHPVAAAALHVLSSRPELGLWLDVECGPHGPAQARRAVVACAALGLDEVVDDLLLVVSELVTNAVRHGAPPVRLEVLADQGVVRVAVGDGDPGLPQPREVADEDEGGRGMVLVDLLSREHGVQQQPPGKTVWASVPRPGADRP